MNIRAVLFPTDFSAASDRAGAVARELARQAGARMHVVHVVPPVTSPGQARQLLADLGGSLGPEERVETALLAGRPAREIVRYAREREIDLIVLGTHGRTGVTRVILGSVAEAVVRLAPCPVLTVPLSVAAAPVPAEEPAAEPAAPPPVPSLCVVCARESDELICETCRARIRGEALERRAEAERPGRRGTAG